MDTMAQLVIWAALIVAFLGLLMFFGMFLYLIYTFVTEVVLGREPR